MPTPATIRAMLPPQLIHASRLLIATNRGPVEYYLTQDKTLKLRRGAGGMVTALIGAANSMEVTWVAFHTVWILQRTRFSALAGFCTISQQYGTCTTASLAGRSTFYGRNAGLASIVACQDFMEVLQTPYICDQNSWASLQTMWNNPEWFGYRVRQSRTCMTHIQGVIY